MGGVDMSNAFLVSYHSTREMLKKYYQKHFCYLIGICCLNSYLLYKKERGQIYKVGIPIQASREFDVEVTQN
jgi:hypothetical protein